ncbi:hypothetical protein [Reinekea forsetii]|nr:hypothetical protein [Reinekea forsetii]
MNCWQASVAENDFLVEIYRPASEQAVIWGCERHSIVPFGPAKTLINSRSDAA